LSGDEVIYCADAGKDAIAYPQRRIGSGDKTTNLRHDLDQDLLGVSGQWYVY
jgi:hypothetical protein